MTKTSSLVFAAAALTAVAGLSFPVLAEDDAGTSFNDDLVRAALADRGIHVSDLAQSFNKIRATVQLPDGTTQFQYFDIDTLQPLGADGSTATTTRVLSDLDVGAQPAQPNLHSLTWDAPVDNN